VSLVTLTFGSGYVENYQISGVKSRNDGSRYKITENGKVKIIKITEFFGRDDICVLGELIDGCVGPKMCSHFDNNKKAEILEIESKYGMKPVSRKGTKLTLMINGVKKSDLEKKGGEIEFVPQLMEELQEKPKGKVIIC